MRPKIEDFLGKTFVSVETDEEPTYKASKVTFTQADGTGFILYHEQDCCENVVLEEVIGDLNDLVDSPIFEAEEASNFDNPPEGYNESHTWTFYKFGTIKGFVTLRWLGTSSGYYSESVDIAKF